MDDTQLKHFISIVLAASIVGNLFNWGGRRSRRPYLLAAGLAAVLLAVTLLR